MDRLFELLKKLKNSNYYYYADFDEEDLSDSEARLTVKKDADKKFEKTKKPAEVKTTKSKETATKVTPITPSVSKQMSLNATKRTAKQMASPSTKEESTEEELANRVDALKTQVELLKKSKNKESDLLKAQFVELRREKEAIELQREIDRKQIRYYQNLEAANELLQKQLAVESEKVSHLHGKLQGNASESQRIVQLEAELERTKAQLLKHIKNATPDVKEAVDFTLEIARLEEELEAATTKMEYYVEYNEQLEIQVSQQAELAKQQAELTKAAALKEQTEREQAVAKQPGQLESLAVTEEQAKKGKLTQDERKPFDMERYDKETASDVVNAVVEESTNAQPHVHVDFSDSLKVLYRELAETKKEAHLLFDEVMTVVHQKSE